MPATAMLAAAAEATWVLPPTRALWIPAGLRHETASDGGRATMRSLYIRPGLFPAPWPEPQGAARPTPVSASPLLAELIGYLGQPGLDPGRPKEGRSAVQPAAICRPPARSASASARPAIWS